MNIFFSPVLAQVINNKALGPIGSLSPSQFFNKLIPALVSLGLVVGVLFFIFNFIWGAVLWISSGGDKMKVEQARSKLLNALIGVVVLLSFIAILNLVELFFGIGLRYIYIGPFDISLTK